MEVVYWDTVSPPPDSCLGGVLSIGNFDGVHKGHAALLRRLRRLRERLGTRSLVMTFDPPPQVLLRPQFPIFPLTTIPQRLQLLERFHVDVAVVLMTTPRLLNLTSDEFLDDLLGEKLRVQGLVEGRNFGFGKDRTGDVVKLQAWCKRRRIALEVVDDVYRQGMKISSSMIRDLIAVGDVERAWHALGHSYSITGKVVRGDERGRNIGFPTANLEQIETLIPGVGVYAAMADVPGNRYYAAVNVGPNPTFGVTKRKVEAHLLDFEGDLYGTELSLEFLERLRDTQPFPSLAALQEQLGRDVQAVREKIAVYLKRIKERIPHE
jgi:riboflavin kinase/FMN adenylyltransferase